MSDGKVPVSNVLKTNAESGNTPAAALGPGGNPLVPQMKDTAILVGWIAGLVLIAGLVWFLTQPVRSTILSKAVNQALEQSGSSHRLEAPVSPGALKHGVSKMGSWYTMTEFSGRKAADAGAKENPGEVQPVKTTAFIFAFIGEGAFFPCAAIVSPEGKVEEFIPLSGYGEKIIKRVSPEILKLYTRRIEGTDL